jgi:hypothetical protein
MDQRDRRTGPLGYAVVMVALFGYFAWILDRMAAFTAHGLFRLDKLVIGLGLVVLALVVVGAADALRRRRVKGGPRGG